MHSRFPWLARLAIWAQLLLLMASCDASSGEIVDARPVDATAGEAAVDASLLDTAPELGVPDAILADGSDGFVLPPPPTTVKQTIQGVLPAAKQDNSNKILFGLTKTGPGEPHLERDDLVVKLTRGPSTGEPVSLLFIVQLTDLHVIDEESPLRLVKYDSIVQSAYRMNEMFNCQVLDAMIRTINRLGDAYRPLDAAVFTGDLIDNNQHNELMWFVDILEGKAVDPDSGADEDPLPGPHNDPNDPFQAAGLRPDTPWIAVIGNHDQLVQGSVSAIWPNGVPDAAILQWFPGIEPLISNDDACLLDCFDFSATPAQQLQLLKADPRYAIALGTLAESAVFPTVTPVTSSEIGPGTVVADPGRQLITANQWISALLQSASNPPGHGMSQDNLVNDHGCYSYDPVPGIPLRVIALEMVSKSLVDGSALGTLRREIFDNFLVPQLDQALNDGVLVVVVSHHQSWSFPPAGLFTPYPFQSSKRDLTTEELVSKINSYPNVVLHLVGHGHTNVVQPHAAPDGDPLKGYWEVETASTNFWPQQARLIEIVDNRDGTGTVYATMLDYEIPLVDVPGWPHKDIAAQGRHYGLYDVQMGFGKDGSGTAADRNVLLHFAIPPSIRAKIDGLDKAGALTGRTVQSTGF